MKLDTRIQVFVAGPPAEEKYKVQVIIICHDGPESHPGNLLVNHSYDYGRDSMAAAVKVRQIVTVLNELELDIRVQNAAALPGLPSWLAEHQAKQRDTEADMGDQDEVVHPPAFTVGEYGKQGPMVEEVTRPHGRLVGTVTEAMEQDGEIIAAIELADDVKPEMFDGMKIIVDASIPYDASAPFGYWLAPEEEPSADELRTKAQHIYHQYVGQEATDYTKAMLVEACRAEGVPLDTKIGRATAMTVEEWIAEQWFPEEASNMEKPVVGSIEIGDETLPGNAPASDLMDTMARQVAKGAFPKSVLANEVTASAPEEDAETPPITRPMSQSDDDPSMGGKYKCACGAYFTIIGTQFKVCANGHETPIKEGQEMPPMVGDLTEAQAEDASIHELLMAERNCRECQGWINEIKVEERDDLKQNDPIRRSYVPGHVFQVCEKGHHVKIYDADLRKWIGPEGEGTPVVGGDTPVNRHQAEVIDRKLKDAAPDTVPVGGRLTAEHLIHAANEQAKAHNQPPLNEAEMRRIRVEAGEVGPIGHDTDFHVRDQLEFTSHYPGGKLSAHTCRQDECDALIKTVAYIPSAVVCRKRIETCEKGHEVEVPNLMNTVENAKAMAALGTVPEGDRKVPRVGMPVVFRRRLERTDSWIEVPAVIEWAEDEGVRVDLIVYQSDPSESGDVKVQSVRYVPKMGDESATSEGTCWRWP